MGSSTTYTNALAAAWAAMASSAMLATTDPGTSGTNEITGGSPPYARQAPSWTVSGATASATIPFDVGNGVTVGGAGFLNSSAVFLKGGAVTPFTFTGQGKYALNATWTGA